MKLKIMTFNIRNSHANDGINSFKFRKPHILEVIRKYEPHIIGFQEVTDEIYDFFCDSIRDKYELIACGRDADLHGERSAIAYKKDDFAVIKSETFWLSPTPDVPASTYGADQSRWPRITTYALMKAYSCGAPFIVANTHFDHLGKEARLKSAKQMCAFFAGSKHPVFFTGDFNAEPSEPTIKTICRDFTDLTADIPPTFHNYGDREDARIKIDYVFSSVKDIKSTATLVSDGPFDGVYPSDHYPVLVTVDYN